MRVPLPKGAVSDLTHLRLRANDAGDSAAEVAAQFTTDERWDDGSAQWVALDFNASNRRRARRGCSVSNTAMP